MNEHSIIFSGEMVRAILEGRKTQARRVVNPIHWPWFDKHGAAEHCLTCPYGQPGDRLWVRETWRPYCIISGIRAPQRLGIIYRADNAKIQNPAAGNVWRMDWVTRWRSPIHMPRWASRITLEIKGVRVERLQDISQADARDEGAECPLGHPHDPEIGYRLAYRDLWDSINAKRGHSWDSNPWVWVVEFKGINP
jgi:hypothetical protein